MSTVERIGVGKLGYKKLERAVLDGGAGVLGQISVHTSELIEQGERTPMLRWAADLDRLAARVRRSDDPALAVGAGAALEASLVMLDAAVTRVAQRDDAARRAEEAVGVRGRVEALLAGAPVPLRTGDIAARLGIAPSQASRALRELRERGTVAQGAAPASATDGRERYFSAAA